VTQHTWKVHKFGGSSLADASCFRNVADILLALPDARVGVVVSAIRGMTDQLLALVDSAEKGGDPADLLDELQDRYLEIATALLAEDRLAGIREEWAKDRAAIDILLGAATPGEQPGSEARDTIAGYGEIWSARLLAAFLAQQGGEQRAGRWLDARDVLRVRQADVGALVQWQDTEELFAQSVAQDETGIIVITGFIARDKSGRQTTLGRNGSDYSASIFAALMRADLLTIWTDVNGVMSADPRRVPEARIIDSLSYNEAMELAYFGAKVIHPQALGPAISHDIPIRIRNSFNPDHPGSFIAPGILGDELVKGVTAISGMALLNLEGSGLIGVPGVADRLFAALRQAGVSVSLISQASSEHSICVAVRQETADRARDVVLAAFAEELADGHVERVDITPDQSILAVVGDGMAGSPGIAARFFGTLGRAGINVRAIAQGASERNISAVVRSSDTTRALRAAHSGFYLSSKTLSIGLIGPGLVGSALLDQIAQEHRRLYREFNLDLRVRAIARASRMIMGERLINLDTWRDQLAASEAATNLDELARHTHAEHLPHSVIIDCTASDEVAGRYGEWLAAGIHIITPNKKAFSGTYSAYEALREMARQGSTNFLYETTVGAALPVIQTLRDLIDTGDRIRSVEGILSGTLGYLFNQFDGSTPFSRIVRDARSSGYTEPDPREDLSGMDVARKLTILAREFGQRIEIGDFSVESLVPAELAHVSVDEFLDRLSEYDDQFLALYEKARSRNCNLRYVGRLDAKGSASVGLDMVPANHPFSRIRFTDNIIQFTTARYSDNPLVVQGPGAGPEVTAGGVFADLLRLAAYLGGGRGG
jgi:aspartokinase/homoserine dehydrogenase 1